MRTYQTVIILKPDLDDSQVGESSEKISQYITKFEGSVVKTDVWGKKRLAYRVKKNRFGIYLNLCHTLDGSKLAEFENELRLYDQVVKYLVIRLTKEEQDRLCGEESVSLEDDESSGQKNGDSKAKPAKETT